MPAIPSAREGQSPFQNLEIETVISSPAVLRNEATSPARATPLSVAGDFPVITGGDESITRRHNQGRSPRRPPRTAVGPHGLPELRLAEQRSATAL
jgi:hypothetical protein